MSFAANRDANTTDWLEYVREGLRQHNSDKDYIRKVYAEAATDAHGDFNYTTDVEHTWLANFANVASVSDSAWYKARTYAFLEPDSEYGITWQRPDAVDDEYFSDMTSASAASNRLQHGNSTMTDGPIPLFVVDAQSRFDDDGKNYSIHHTEISSPGDSYFDVDGRIGGWGKGEGQLTALVPTSSEPSCSGSGSGSGSAREVKNYVAYGWENTSDFDSTPTELRFRAMNESTPAWNVDATIPGRKSMQVKPYMKMDPALEGGSEWMVTQPLQSHAMVLEASTKSGSGDTSWFYGLTNPSYVITEKADPSGTGFWIDGFVQEPFCPSSPYWVSPQIDPYAMSVTLDFSESMQSDDGSAMDLSLLQLDSHGNSATSDDSITWACTWDDGGHGENSRLTCHNTETIYPDEFLDYDYCLDGAHQRAGLGPQNFTFVFVIGKPHDSWGNQLNPIAELLTTYVGDYSCL
jgi:hypothetical protein